MPLLSRLSGRGPTAIAWALAIAVISLLGMLRHATEAEYAFASAVIIPVVFVAWTGGLGHGIAVSTLAAGVWIFADLRSGREFGDAWIPLVNGLTRLATYSFVSYLTAQARKLLRLQVEMATHDSVTGLLNQRAFLELGQSEAQRAARYAHPMAVAFLDLDEFKQINDTLGHVVGDEALRAVGAALKRTLRATDSVARLGGDEFAIVLPEIEEKAAVRTGRKIATRVTAALKRFPPASASIGVVWFEQPEGEFEPMLEAADALMYEVKREGKGGFRTQSFPARAESKGVRERADRRGAKAKQ